MTTGEKIAAARKEKHMTQARLAEKVDVSFQAVSAWERDEYLPDSKKLIAVSEALGLSMDKLFGSEEKPDWELHDPYFNPASMYNYLMGFAKAHGLKQTAAALPYMKQKHEGQFRKGRPVPYYVHPLTAACHAMNMGIIDDDVLAACLLHDVLEDTDAREAELPVGDRVKKAVRLLSYNTYDESRADLDDLYYGNIAKNELAALVKCLDRCNNLSVMADGLGKEQMIRFIELTERYVMPLLDVVKGVFEWNSAAWLLRYQIRSLVETFKRTL